MRNWASAAHPNNSEITGLQLVSWLETCIKEVITLPISNVTIRIKLQFLQGVKKNTTISGKHAQDMYLNSLTLQKLTDKQFNFFYSLDFLAEYIIIDPKPLANRRIKILTYYFLRFGGVSMKT